MTLDLLKRGEKTTNLTTAEHDANFTAIENAVNGKADTSHTHTVSDITDAGELASLDETNLPAATADYRGTGPETLAQALSALSGGDPSIVTLSTTDLSSAAWLLDEDDMASDSASKAATQQSIRAYVTVQLETFGLGSVNDNSIFSIDGAGDLTNPELDELTGLIVESDGAVKTRLDSVDAQGSGVVLFLTEDLQKRRSKKILVNVGATAFDIVVPDSDAVSHAGAEWDIHQGAGQSGAVRVHAGVTLLAYDGATSLTTVADAVFSGASGASVNLTSAGANLPTVSEGQRFYSSANTNTENNGIFTVGSSPTTSAIALTKVSNLGGGALTNPVNQASESIDCGLAFQLGEVATGNAGGTGVVAADDGVTAQLVVRNATAYVNDEALSGAAGFAALVNGTETAPNGTINGGAYVQLLGARASVTVVVDSTSGGDTPVIRAKGDTTEDRTTGGDLDITGDATVGGTLDVTGAATFGDVEATGDVDLSAAGIQVPNGSSVSGTLTRTAHGGGTYKTSGNCTITPADGFSVTLYLTGAHTVGAGGTAHNGASGDVVSVVCFGTANGDVKLFQILSASVVDLPTS